MVAAVRGGQAKRPAATPRTRAPKASKTASIVTPRLIFAAVGGTLVLGVGIFLNTGDQIGRAHV